MGMYQRSKNTNYDSLNDCRKMIMVMSFLHDSLFPVKLDAKFFARDTNWFTWPNKGGLWQLPNSTAIDFGSDRAFWIELQISLQTCNPMKAHLPI